MKTSEAELKEIAKEIRKTVKWDYTQPAKKLAEHVTRLEGIEGEKALERARKLLFTRSKHK